MIAIPRCTILAVTLLVLVGAGQSTPAAVPADVRSIFGKPVYKNATWALRVLDGSKVLVDFHSDRKLFIGSVRKVFSVGELLDAVGANRRYNTPVYRFGRVNGGVLHGNLVIVASGDLTMGGRTNPDGSIAVSDWDHNEADSLGNAVLTKPDPLAGYEELARRVRDAGISRVDGEIVVDDRLFQPFNFRGQFDVRPIFVNDDVVDLTITPGGTVGAKTNLTHRPVSAALAIDNRLRNGPQRSTRSIKIDPEYPACIGTPHCTATVSGSLPVNFTPPLTGGKTVVQTVRITEPSNYARTVFIESLRKAGVTVSAPAVENNPTNLLPPAAAYTPANRVAMLRGMTYGQDAKLILKISYNIGADTSLVLFGVSHGVHSMPAALAVERTNLARRFGIPPTEYHFVDGSGGGETTASSRAVTQMLQQLQRRRAFAMLYADLPVLGVDGSLASIKSFERDPTLAGAAGRVHAKTGTYVAASASGATIIKGQAFGGYITTKRGRHLIYQLVVNNVPMTSLGDLLQVFQDEGTVSAMLWRDY